MLDAKTNRLDYGEQLIPLDSSYELDFAVGTTYSLDLEAIMVLPVAMFYSRPLDCSPDALHFDVLDAITQSASKIRVYCQKGKIKVPRRYNRLMTYWETGISQISMDNAFSSFHPKIWVVRFTKPGGAPFYRVLITSRNLTYAHDWDMAFATEGMASAESKEKNQPLIQFLQYLSQKDGKPYSSTNRWCRRPCQCANTSGSAARRCTGRRIRSSKSTAWYGESHPDITVATCWDTDRLDLWRLDIEPDPARLLTVAGRNPERIEQAFRRVNKQQDIFGE